MLITSHITSTVQNQNLDKSKSGRCFIIIVNGMPVGQINYNVIDESRKQTELDIWMSCEANCDKGYGTDALQALCEYLFQTYGIVEFMVRPSARNRRAIRAYEKVGFQRIEITYKQQVGFRDYDDSIIMIKHMPSTKR